MHAAAWDAVLASRDDLEALARAVSRILGWSYFLCWSLSFYPQAIQNYRRKSVTGLSVDFLSINVLGFAFYTIYCLLLLFSPTIRAQYAERHPLSPEPTVRYNDLAFGIHAVLISSITWTQLWFWGYTRDRNQRISFLMVGIIIGCFTGIGIVWILAGTHFRGWKLLDVTYALSYAKLWISLVKYTPQAWLNYKRKSTVGWSIHNIILDLSGGVLSLAQLMLDSSMNADWSGVTGNPIKFGLGLIAIVYDIFFCLQHYVFYRGRTEVDVRVSEHARNIDEEQNLLSPSEDTLHGMDYGSIGGKQKGKDLSSPDGGAISPGSIPSSVPSTVVVSESSSGGVTPRR